MLHMLTHVEMNAVDLAWDTLVRFSPLAQEHCSEGGEGEGEHVEGESVEGDERVEGRCREDGGQGGPSGAAQCREERRDEVPLGARPPSSPR